MDASVELHLALLKASRQRLPAGNYGLHQHAYMLALLGMNRAEGKSKQDLVEAEGSWREALVVCHPSSACCHPWQACSEGPFLHAPTAKRVMGKADADVGAPCEVRL